MALQPDPEKQSRDIHDITTGTVLLKLYPEDLPDTVSVTDVLKQAGGVATDVYRVEIEVDEGVWPHAGVRLRFDSEGDRAGLHATDGPKRFDTSDVRYIGWYGPLDGDVKEREVVDCRRCGDTFVLTAGNSTRPGVCVTCRQR